ncbi:MAG: hypothetical protein MZU97_08635 [Bacillus subtilis]|nr:hypothetical protein [Bacillus subtilis]
MKQRADRRIGSAWLFLYLLLVQHAVDERFDNLRIELDAGELLQFGDGVLRSPSPCDTADPRSSLHTRPPR